MYFFFKKENNNNKQTNKNKNIDKKHLLFRENTSFMLHIIFHKITQPKNGGLVKIQDQNEVIGKAKTVKFTDLGCDK